MCTLCAKYLASQEGLLDLSFLF